MAHVGLSVRLPDRTEPGTLVEAMRRDKKRRGGRLRFVLLRGVGDVVVTGDVSGDDLVAVLGSLNP
jgi:3-dehydroquinate synthase